MTPSSTEVDDLTLGSLLKFANFAQDVDLDNSLFSSIGSSHLGYYLIYDGGDNMLPRWLLARIYRAKFPSLSYVSTFASDENENETDESGTVCVCVCVCFFLFFLR